MRNRLMLALATVTAAVLLSACASGGASTPSPTASAPSDDIQGGTQPTSLVPLTPFPDSDELASWCPLDVEAVHLHQLTSDVSSAAVCSTSVGDDGFATTTVSTVSGGLDELLTAYAEPNAPVDPTVMCTLQLEDPLLVWLTYPGERSYPVYAPVGPCGFPTDEAKAAFQALELTPVLDVTATSDGVTTTDIGLGQSAGPHKETT